MHSSARLLFVIKWQKKHNLRNYLTRISFFYQHHQTLLSWDHGATMKKSKIWQQLNKNKYGKIIKMEWKKNWKRVEIEVEKNWKWQAYGSTLNNCCIINFRFIIFKKVLISTVVIDILTINFLIEAIVCYKNCFVQQYLQVQLQLVKSRGPILCVTSSEKLLRLC